MKRFFRGGGGGRVPWGRLARFRFRGPRPPCLRAGGRRAAPGPGPPRRRPPPAGESGRGVCSVGSEAPARSSVPAAAARGRAVRLPPSAAAPAAPRRTPRRGPLDPSRAGTSPALRAGGGAPWPAGDPDPSRGRSRRSSGATWRPLLYRFFLPREAAREGIWPRWPRQTSRRPAALSASSRRRRGAADWPVRRRLALQDY